MFTIPFIPSSVIVLLLFKFKYYMFTIPFIPSSVIVLLLFKFKYLILVICIISLSINYFMFFKLIILYFNSFVKNIILLLSYKSIFILSLFFYNYPNYSFVVLLFIIINPS
jgi:hypothetical protein